MSLTYKEMEQEVMELDKQEKEDIIDLDFLICHYTRVGNVSLFNIFGFIVFKKVANVYSLFGLKFKGSNK